MHSPSCHLPRRPQSLVRVMARSRRWRRRRGSGRRRRRICMLRMFIKISDPQGKSSSQRHRVVSSCYDTMATLKKKKNQPNAAHKAGRRRRRSPWLMKAAGPSHSCAQRFLVEYMTLKSLTPARSTALSAGLSSAMQPSRTSTRWPTNLPGSDSSDLWPLSGRNAPDYFLFN